jgi:hypothetical protein
VPAEALLGEDPLAVHLDLEHPAAGWDQVDTEIVAELVEDPLRHAHGTAGVVTGTAELDGDATHPHRSRDTRLHMAAIERNLAGCTLPPPPKR